MPPDCEMVSLDVVAMYDTIPLSRVYKTITNRWTKISEITSIPQKLFFELISFCVDSNNYFQHNFEFFKAKKGLAIGGCVSPILADFVITDLINEALAKLSYDPILLTKYVDDILLFGPRDEMEETLNVFNKIDDSIQFTIEYENFRSITYLDLKLLRNFDGSISTDFFMKPTNKGRLLNYASDHPRYQKINVAHNFASRVFTLSSVSFWKKNKTMVREILAKNGYPSNIIESLLSKQQLDKFKNASNQTIEEENKEIRRYLPCTYVKGFSESLRKLVKHCDSKIGIGFKPQKTMKQIYPAKKDKIPKLSKSGLVYSIACKGCEKSYIGQTKCKLKNRMAQHKNDNKNKYAIAAAKQNKTSAVHHSLLTGHIFDYDNPQILCMERNLNRRLTKEMALIKKEEGKVVNLKTELSGFHNSLDYLCSKL